ncbi:MAG: acyl carrier protein [Candidatus Omnitrophica bacterium]|nr:acyl carrier protein [Candidatus Omnitrophota bacterium]
MENKIRNTLIDYVHRTSLTLEGGKENIPLDVSLVEAGILDSFGIIELVAFIEQTWKVEITPKDFTIERMGSINKMAKLIAEKVQK